MRLIQIGLFALLVLLQYRFWFADNGQMDKKRLEAEIAIQKEELAVQQSKNDNLRARVVDLKTSNDTVEELARQNLGLIKPGETFILFTGEDYQ